MSIKSDILKELTSGAQEYISGEELAKKLGVSRNSIWKAVNALKKDGFMINATTNKGYNLLANNNTLSKESVKNSLQNYDAPIFVYKSVGSTNDVAKDLAAKGAEHGTIIIADEQTKGKGRMGRRFESPSKTGTYVSIILRPKFSAQEALFITTSAAVATAQAIEEVSNRETKIKWVNDIYIENKKVSGILTEASTDFETGMLEYAVLGIGINVSTPLEGFPDEIKDIAGSVYENECPDNARIQIISSLIRNFFKLYDKLPNKDFVKIYREKSFLTGKIVSFENSGKLCKGKVLDVDEDARLVIENEDKSVSLFSTGEVNIYKDFL